MAPEYKNAAAQLKDIKLVAIDANADENKDIAAEYQVQGFPTLKVWNKKYGTGMSDYDGGRTADAIVEFMNKENKPLVGEISTLAETKGSKPTFVLVGNPETYTDVAAVAAENKANMNFHWIATEAGQEEGSILLIEDGKVGPVLEKGGDLKEFVKKNA